MDPYADRLAKVRKRFVSALEGKIEETYAAIPNLTGETSAVIEVVGETYRRMHDLVGIGPTIGFIGTGRIARRLEKLLLAPHQAGRGLTIDEIATFTRTLHTLRAAAASELRLL